MKFAVAAETSRARPRTPTNWPSWHMHQPVFRMFPAQSPSNTNYS